jgi:hypothetical protein
VEADSLAREMVAARAADGVSLICDACAAPLGEDDQDEDGPAGQGAYLWLRGDRVEVERVPLCSACASAIGMTALARCEIEEEEG